MITNVLRKLAALSLVMCWMGVRLVAAEYTLRLDTLLNGTQPTNSGPWLSVTFSNVFPGTVSIILEAMLDSPEFISEVAFNINPELNDVPLQLVQTSGPTASSITLAAQDNGVTVPGGGPAAKGFDLLVSWPNENKADRFDLSDIAVLTVTGPPELDAEDFFFGNTINGADSNIVVAAHVQGTVLPDGTTTSGTIGVFLPPTNLPEPSSIGLMCLAGGMVWVRSYLRQRRPQ